MSRSGRRLPVVQRESPRNVAGDDAVATCADAEPFALRVLDDSMAPEFRCGCIVIVDPSALAVDGCFVLAEPAGADGALVLRKLELGKRAVVFRALNARFDSVVVEAAEGSERALARHLVKGVVAQRAGTRRGYHKRYL